MYLIDLYNYKPPDELIVDREEARRAREQAARDNTDNFRRANFNTDDLDEALDMLDFNYKIIARSGLAEVGTYVPKSIHFAYNPIPQTNTTLALEEAHMVMTGAVEGLMQRQGLKASDIDILVTTCSCFCPTPSLASMLVNHFKLRSDIHAYHLGGMGCSNGVVAVNLVQDMLKARPNCNAVLVTTEIITPNFYKGRDKHRQVTNMIFRMGCAAVLFSNKRRLVAKAKYRLLHNVRVHIGSRDAAYRCIWNGPDDEGLVGTYLSKEVVNEASRGLTQAMWKIGPKVLTVGQMLEYAVTEVRRLLLGKGKVAPYKPQFGRCLDHFLIHAGGAKILDGIGKELQLDEETLEPSRMVLHDYGNVSSSTTWYTLGYLESVRGTLLGQKLLQIGVGSGVKCGVNVWQALQDTWDVQDAWAHRAPRDSPLKGRRGAHSSLLGRGMVLLALLVLLVAAGVQLMAATEAGRQWLAAAPLPPQLQQLLAEVQAGAARGGL